MVAPVLFDVDGLRREIDEAALARLQAAKTGADIVFVGRVAPHKAQHDLIITTYHVAARDIEALGGVQWTTVVFEKTCSTG